MSKKKKHRFNTARPPATSSATPPAPGAPRHLPLADALSAGRVRKAFALAKDLLSLPNLTVDELALIAQATERKALQMHREGNANQIDVMAQSMIKRAPLLANMFRPEYRVFFLRKPPYAAYETDAAVREQLDAYVLHLLRDPAELTENKDISDQHPLKQNARLIMATWEKIEAGKADLDELNRSIGRRSPFVAWRLFLNALNAWYDGQKDLALDNLRRIPDDAALRSLATDLHIVINNETTTLTADKIIAATKNNTLKKNLQDIENIILNDGAKARAQSLMGQTFTPELRQNSPVLYRNLLALLIHQIAQHAYDQFKWSDLFPASEEHDRAYAITEIQRHVIAEDNWRSLLDKYAFTPQEKALIYDLLASGNSLRLQPESDFIGWQYAPRITKTQARKIYDHMAQLWENSVASYPLREAFQKWHTIAETILPPAQSDNILERWLKAFPDDEAAARKLLKSARKRHVYTKASSLLQRLQERFPQDPELNTDAAFLELEKALAAISKRDHTKARAILGDKPPAPGIFFAACHRTLRNACGDQQAPAYPVIDAFIHKRLADNKFRLPADNQTPPEVMSATDFFAETDAIFAVADPVWGNAGLPELHLPQSLTGLDAIPCEKLWDFCTPFLENDHLYAYGSRQAKFLWNLTQHALNRRDPRWTGAFLLPRVLVMHQASCRLNHFGNAAAYHKRQKKVIDLLALASKCLLDADNVAPQKFIHDFLDQLDINDGVIAKKRDQWNQKQIKALINDAINTSIDSILDRVVIPESSQLRYETTNYPIILHDFTLENDDDEDDDDEDDFDDDFDDDDDDDTYNSFDPDDAERMLDELTDLLHKLHAANKRGR